MEIWDILDAHGNRTGRTHERGKPLLPGDYHLIVDVWIRNAAGEYLISHRTPEKEPFANLWEPTCGCAQSGDTSLNAALREVREELGISLDAGAGKMIHEFVNHTYQYILNAWLFEWEGDIRAVTLQPGETDEAKWASKAEVLDMMKNGEFIGFDRIVYIDEL